MRRRLQAVPLRMRVTFLYILLGLVLSLLFACTVSFITEDYEGVLVEEILRSQAQDYAVRLRSEPDTVLPRSSRLSGYVRHADGSGRVPRELAGLSPGVYDFVAPPDDHVAVFDTDVGRMYFAIDLSGIERLEQHMFWILVAVVLLGTMASAWLGWALSGSVVRPVRRLADKVDGLPSQPVRTDLAATLPGDSLGRLGQAIDDYQARLVAGQEAERVFFADASHELRTPIAVVRGATELLIEDAAGQPALQPRLQRLDRGIRQLSELLDALLGLARRKVGSVGTVALRDWLSDCLERADTVRDGSVKLDISGGNPDCTLPLHEASLVVNGMARQLAPAGTAGTLQAVVHDDGMTLQLLDGNGQDAATGQGASNSDRGFGMTLVGRLAGQIGWQVQEDPGHRRIRIRLP